MTPLMKEIEIKFFSQKQFCTIGLTSPELLLIFQHRIEILEDNRLIVKSEELQVYSEKIQTNLKIYLTRYKQVNPILNKLEIFFNNLKTGEYFYILPNKKLDTSETVELINRLKSFNEGKIFVKLQHEFEIQSGGFWSFYNHLIFTGNDRVNVGTADKKRRKCRFCGKDHHEVTFKNKSHAISEALGNKTVFCQEECDSCNSKFGKGIETELIAFLNFSRTFYGILGKGNNIPKYKGKNFSMNLDESKKIQLEVEAEKIESVIDTGLETHDIIIKQNLYRALCKFVISVIDSDQLAALEKCIEWINGGITLDRLPPIWATTVNDNHSEFPRLAVYIRKTSDTELPHVVGNFRFTNAVWIFILPCSSLDELCFVDFKERKKFWNFIIKQDQNMNWKEIDFSSSKSERLKLEFNLISNDKKTT